MKRIILWLLPAILLTACSEEASVLGEHIAEQSAVHPGDTITVPLNLTVGDMADATPEATRAATRAGIDDPEGDNGVSSKIHNVWVLQYEGNTTTAKLISWHYIKDYQADKTTKLVATSKACTIVTLVNTFKPNWIFAQEESIDKIITSCETVTAQHSLFAYTDDPSASASAEYPNYANHHLRMNGTYYSATGINSSTVPEIILERNIAKVVFNITNPATSGLTILSVQAKSIPNITHYFTNRPTTMALSTTAFPAVGTGSGQVNDWLEFDKPTYTATTGDVTTYTYYMPVNIRGARTTYTDPKKKTFAPPSNATYIEVYGYAMEGERKVPYRYTFYLGANMTTDYNLKPNCKYTYNITYSSPGNPETDFRIESAKVLDYTTWERANCYICNPPPFDLKDFITSETHHSTRQFKIPVDRIDEFWGEKLATPIDGDEYKYEGVPANCLGESNAWEAKLIWCDFNPAEYPDFKLSRATGSGKGDYFTVDVPYGIEGNAVVGVRKTGGSGTEWLWTWHLWITTYNPDVARLYNTTVDTKYQISQREDYVFYQDANYRVIMDRTLGAKATDSGTNAPYFQYGRKDALPQTGKTIYVFNEDGSSYTTGSLGISKTQAHVGASGKNAVVYGLHNPLEFIGGYTSGTESGAWVVHSKYNPTTYDDQIIWNDPYVKKSTYYSVQDKSIFDPTPPGWHIRFGNISGRLDIVKDNASLQPAVQEVTRYTFGVWGYPVSIGQAQYIGDRGGVGVSGGDNPRYYARHVYCEMYHPK